jgi:hypothetical protein
MFKLGSMYRLGNALSMSTVRVYQKPRTGLGAYEVMKAKDVFMPVKIEYDSLARLVHVKVLIHGTMGWFCVTEDIANGVNSVLPNRSNFFHEVTVEETSFQP